MCVGVVYSDGKSATRYHLVIFGVRAGRARAGGGAEGCEWGQVYLRVVMIELGPATENDMVLAFLRAEVDSPRFGAHYRPHLDRSNALGITRERLIENADLNSSRDNALRIELLKAVRGYRANSFLFRSFPDNVMWRRVGVEPADWISVRYANHAEWVELSRDTRVVTDGARNIDSIIVKDANANIRALAAELGEGKRYPDLIGVDDGNNVIILIEGHCRATAYALARLQEIVWCIVGSSTHIKDWAFY
jgi:hypothetical protein